MVLTRSASSSPVKKSTAITVMTSSSDKTQPPVSKSPQHEPLQVIILPKTISPAARFLSLSSSTNRDSRRYLFCPETGLFELSHTSTPKNEPRSILFTSPDTELSHKRSHEALSNGCVKQKAEYLIATPYDLSFILLPLLTESSKSNLFQTLDDILETSSTEVYDLPYVLRKSRSLVEEAIGRVCDTLEAGDETLYRYSLPKTLQSIIGKAKRACKNGLPASLEQKFVTRALDAPLLSVKREESSISLAKSESQDIPLDPSTPSESFDSQSTSASTAPSVVFSETTTVSTSAETTTSTITVTTDSPTSGPPAEIISLQRLMIAFKFIVHSYLPTSLATELLTTLQSPSSGIDFAPLTAHLDQLSKLRAEAAASYDFSSFSRKRGIEDTFEAEERAEKKKRIEEEEKRKKTSLSRGVKELAKVNVQGMKKMSSFFTKMPAKGKS